MQRLSEGLKKATAATVVAALLWTTPGFEFYAAAAEDTAAPAAAAADTGRVFAVDAPAGSAAPILPGDAAPQAPAFDGLGAAVALPQGAADAARSVPATVNGVPSAASDISESPAAELGSSADAAAATPAAAAATSATTRSARRSPDSLRRLQTPSALDSVQPQASGEDFRSASDSDFRRLTGEGSGERSASAMPSAQSPRTQAAPVAQESASQNQGTGFSLSAIAPSVEVEPHDAAAAGDADAFSTPSNLLGEGRDGGRTTAVTVPPPQSSPTRGEEVRNSDSEIAPSAVAANGVLDSLKVPSPRQAFEPASSPISPADKKSLPTLAVAAAAAWAGWGALRLAAHVTAEAIPLAGAAAVTPAAWWHYAAGRAGAVLLIPVAAVTSLFLLQALIYYVVTWLGADVTPEQFAAFLTRESRARPGLYRGMLGYAPGTGLLKGAFAPSQRTFGVLGYTRSNEIFLRPELIRVPWLFRWVLRLRLLELNAQLGRAPPAPSGIIGRAMNSLSAFGLPMAAAFAGNESRVPQALFLDRVLREGGVSLRLSDPYKVLMVSRPEGPVEAADFQWLSGGKASVDAVSETEAAARVARTEALLDDPSNRGRFRAVYLEEPDDWAPQGTDAKSLDFTLQRMEKVYREVLPKLKAQALASNKPLSAVQIKVWNHVAGSAVAKLGVVKLVSRLYQSLDDRGVAVIPFKPADATLGALQAVFRHWASPDGGYFRAVRVDQREGGNVLIAQKVEPRVRVWLKPAGDATVPSGLQNVARDPIKKQAAEEILKSLGFAKWLPTFREIGVQVLHIQGEDVGDTRVYVSVPRARLRYVENLLAPGQLEASDQSFRPMAVAEEAALKSGAPVLSGNALYESVRRAKGPQAWELAGRGEGMLVYDSDTGIWKDHPAFGGRADETDFVNGGNGDTEGHGTHTAGDMVADDAHYKGTAPAARVHMGKVFGPQGASDGDIQASWGEGQKLGADVYNNSLGGEGSADHPLAQAASGLTRRKNSKGEYAGVVASAGNSGQDDETVGPPGAGDEVLTVASAEKPEADGRLHMARYSSGGWAYFNYDFGLVRPVAKPEIAASGGNVNNPNEKGDVFERGVISTRSKDAEPSPADEPGGLFTRMSGTSMSGPEVAGAWVIVKSAVYKAAAGNPEALAYAKENLPFVVKMLMMSSAEDLRVPAQKSVAGYLDMEAAAKAAGAFRLAADAPGSWKWIATARDTVDAPRRVYEAAAAAAAAAQQAAQNAGQNTQLAMNAALKARDAAWDEALAKARPSLLAALQDPVWAVRQYAAFAFLSLRDAAALDALQKAALSDPEPRVRQMALQALAELPAADATSTAKSAITAALQDKAPEVRVHAAMALARWNEPAGVSELLTLSASPDEVVRYNAAWALGQIDAAATTAVTERLAALAADAGERGETRDASVASLKKLLSKGDAFTAKAVTDVLNAAGPADLLITRANVGLFQAAASLPAMAKRLGKEPYKPVLAAFVQKYRSYSSKQGSLGSLVRILAKLSGSNLGTPPMNDPAGEGVPGVDENVGPVHLIVELPAGAAKVERTVLAAAPGTQPSGAQVPQAALEQALSGLRFPMEAVDSFGGRVRAVLKEGFVAVEVPGYSALAFTREMEQKGFLVNAAGPKYLYLRDTGPLSGLPAIHGAGVTGKGTVTLVVDEGLEVDNPAFAGKVLGTVNTSGDGAAADDVSNESIGHGTHTGNIAAGAQRPDDNPNIGRAPDSFIIAAKVLGANGGSESTVMEGISAAVQILDDANAKLAAYWQAKDAGQSPALPDNAALKNAIGQGIRHFVATMNLSLGGPGAKDAAMNVQLRKLHLDRGVMVSVAAGNDGPGEGTANGSSPANEWSVKTVGAADKDKKLTFYSNRGTPEDPIVKITHYGGGADLNSDSCPYLPGGIISALAKKAAEAAAKCIVMNAGKPTDQAMSGTSMASPHRAGDDALILQKMLTVFTPDELEKTPGLTLWQDQLAYDNAEKMDNLPHEVGAGLSNVKGELAALDERLKDKAKIVAESLDLYNKAKAREGKQAAQRWANVALASGPSSLPLWALVWKAVSRPLTDEVGDAAAGAVGGAKAAHPGSHAAAAIENARAYGVLRQMRDLLSAGVVTPSGARVEPFAFQTAAGVETAPSAGLEGFFYAKRDLERRLGPDALLAQQDAFFAYLDAQLAPFEWTRAVREDLKRLRADAALTPSDKNARMNAIVETALAGLRARYIKENPASWAHDARIYELDAKTYNLRDKRLGGAWNLRWYQLWRDLSEARGWSSPCGFYADATVSDLKQIQKLGMDAVWLPGLLAGGAAIDPAMGSLADFQAFVKKAHRAGLKVLVDLAPGDFQAAAAVRARNLLTQTGVDGYRVDGAQRMPVEFLDKLAWEVKTANPAAALLGEAGASSAALSAAGFDALYESSAENGGSQQSFQEALKSRDPQRLARSLERLAFQSWQVAGAAGARFSGGSAEQSPKSAFGDWMKAALFLTWLLPGTHFFHGTQELGYDRADAATPVEADWRGADSELVTFYKGLFRQGRLMRRALKQPRLSVVSGEGWVGYVLDGAGAKQAYAVLSNPGAQALEAGFERPDLGVSYRGRLNPMETTVLSLPVSHNDAGGTGLSGLLGANFPKIANVMSSLAFFAFLPMMPAQIHLNWQYYHAGNLQALQGVSTVMMSCAIIGNLLNLPGFLRTGNPWFIVGCSLGVVTTWIALLPLYLAGVFPSGYFFGLTALIGVIGAGSYAGWRSNRKR